MYECEYTCVCVRTRMHTYGWRMRETVLSGTDQIQKEDSDVGFCSDNWEN